MDISTFLPPSSPKMQRKSFQKLHFGQKEKPFTLKQEKSTRKVDWNQKKANILGLVLMTKMLPSSTFLSFGLFFQHLIVVLKMKYEQEQVLWKKWQQTTVELSWKDLHNQNVAKKSKIERSSRLNQRPIVIIMGTIQALSILNNF